ncbi:hypothetical protein SteCoe_28512 [Stentor coeruleus]|uniref:Calmodulin n=1 Tax=Stentor coeruleus TaxID=5963 RepID=A0A1R2B8K6_9CILI|nr:hypothetical protein SteCoe_28512 [Stentor coeruleus]
MMEQLNEAQIMEFKEAFLIFDKSAKNLINTEDLGSAVRSLGYNPSESEIKDMINKVDAGGNGTIDFYEFLSLVAGMVNDEIIDDKLNLVLNILDRDPHGFVSALELRHAAIKI